MVYIVYGPQLLYFNTFGQSISQLFMILLGAINYYHQMSQASPYFTPVFFISFIFMMFFVVLNIFVAILNEAFSVVVALEEKDHEKDLLRKFKNRLVAELKHYYEKFKYFCKKCCKTKTVQRSLAFKAFNRT